MDGLAGFGIDRKITMPLSGFLNGLDLDHARAVGIAGPDPASLQRIVLG